MPSSYPNSGPANVQIFYLQIDFRYAFCILQANTSRLFNDAIVKATLTEFLDTIDNNLIREGAVAVCPPPIIGSFLLKLSPSLISNIIWHLICWYTDGRSSLLPLYA